MLCSITCRVFFSVELDVSLFFIYKILIFFFILSFLVTYNNVSRSWNHVLRYFLEQMRGGQQDKQADTQTDVAHRQTDRQTDKQTDI